MIREIGLVFIAVIVLIFIFYKSKKSSIVGKRGIPRVVRKKKEIKVGGYRRDTGGPSSITSKTTGEVLQVNNSISSRIQSHEDKIAPVTIEQIKHMIDEEVETSVLSKQESTPVETITKTVEAELNKATPDPRYYGGTSFD